MKMSAPALASKHVGCNDEFVTDGLNGFLLDPMDADAWVAKIEQLLDDSGLARRIGASGREVVERECDIRKNVLDINSVYNELAS